MDDDAAHDKAASNLTNAGGRCSTSAKADKAGIRFKCLGHFGRLPAARWWYSTSLLSPLRGKERSTPYIGGSTKGRTAPMR
jgi:hypothetical protein